MSPTIVEVIQGLERLRDEVDQTAQTVTRDPTWYVNWDDIMGRLNALRSDLMETVGIVDIEPAGAGDAILYCGETSYGH